MVVPIIEPDAAEEQVRELGGRGGRSPWRQGCTACWGLQGCSSLVTGGIAELRLQSYCCGCCVVPGVPAQWGSRLRRSGLWGQGAAGLPVT
jgi:hypothetical protein